MAGEGRYEWVGLDGERREAAHWDELPGEMDRLIAFVPDSPPPPHTEEEHEAMAVYVERLQEALGRCRR